MRLATLLILTNVAAASVSSSWAPGGGVRIEGSRAGASLQVSLLGEARGRIKVRTTVKRRDGTRSELPSLLVENPSPNTRIEGPVLPGDAGGDTVIVEIFDADTGERLGKGGAPIGF